jgi:uncharacterized membrane protein YdjX (TVP38/TMEM64 family)
MAAAARAPYACRVDQRTPDDSPDAAQTPGDRAALPPTGNMGSARRLARFIRRLGPAGPLALVAATLPTVSAVFLLGTLTVLAPLLRRTPMAPALCVAAFTVAGGLSLLPTYALSVVAGWSFGFPVGFAVSMGGILGASLVAYGVAQRASGQRFLAMIDENPNWRAVHLALLGGGYWRAVMIIVLLRMAPFPPFSITNLVMGAAHVKVSRFTLGTLLGMAPNAAIIAGAAAGLEQVSFRAAEQPWLIAGGVAAMVAVITVIGRLARRALEAVAVATAEAVATPDPSAEADLADAHPPNTPG